MQLSFPKRALCTAIIASCIVAGSLTVAREFGDSVVGIVEDRVITVFELHQLSREREEALRNLYQGEELEEKIVRLRKAVAREIINRELLYREFEALGAKVPTDLVQERIDRAVRSECGGDRERFEAKLHEVNMTLADFAESARKELAADLLLQEKVARLTRVSPKQIENYYRDNASELATSAKVRLQVIVLNKAENDKTDETLRKTVTAIQNKLRQGTPFGELAREYSIGPNAEKGGDRGWLTNLDDLHERFRKAIEPMQAGSVSQEPLEIGDKIYFIKVADREEGGIPKLDAELRTKIERILKQKDYQRRYENYINELKQKYFVQTPDDLTE